MRTIYSYPKERQLYKYASFYFITERYDYVGKLLKPGEAPTNYSDEEDEGSQQETETKSESYDAEKKTDHSETAGKSKSD